MASESRLYITLGDLKNAVIAYLRCGELASAAQTCETLATANSAEAEHWLQEAIKHYRKAKQPVESFDLLLRHPQLQATLSGQVLHPRYIWRLLLPQTTTSLHHIHCS